MRLELSKVETLLLHAAQARREALEEEAAQHFNKVLGVILDERDLKKDDIPKNLNIDFSNPDMAVLTDGE